MGQFLNINQISEILGKSPRTVQRIIARGELPKYKLPQSKGYFCKVEDVMQYKNENESGINWFSAKQASKYLGINYMKFYQLVSKYNVPFAKTYGSYERLRYKKEDIFDLEKKLQEKGR